MPWNRRSCSDHSTDSLLAVSIGSLSRMNLRESLKTAVANQQNKENSKKQNKQTKKIKKV